MFDKFRRPSVRVHARQDMGRASFLIAQGIYLMPHIKDHPDWQVCLTLDGFSSHLVPAGLAPFTAANITIIKEEGERGHNAGEPSIQSISGQKRQEGHQRVA